jgi:hypothetical protein
MQTGMPYIYDVPRGMEEVVVYYKQRYNNTATYITENGVTLSCLFLANMQPLLLINQGYIIHHLWI